MNATKYQPPTRISLPTNRTGWPPGVLIVGVLVFLAVGCEQRIPATAPIPQKVTPPASATTSAPVPATTTTPVIITPPPSPPVPVTTTLPQPYTRPTGGAFPYGTVIHLVVDSLPQGTVLELSTDNGQHWQTADSVILQSAVNLQVRSRRDMLASLTGSASFAVVFKRVLIVGNSITLHSPQERIGWLGNWGMAASAPANDYVHKLTERLQGLNPQVDVRVYSAIPFEQQFWAFDYQTVRAQADFKPDLLIMRIGENVPVNAVVSQNFKLYYQRLIDSLTVKYAPVKVVCTTSFFDQPSTSELIRQVAAARQYVLADFNGLVNNRAYQAYGLFSDPGVAAHPGDYGMLAITNLIWDKVR